MIGGQNNISTYGVDIERSILTPVNVTVSNCIIRNWWRGILNIYANGVLIFNNTVNGTLKDYGDSIDIYQSININVTNNILSSSVYAIEMDYSSNNTIYNNTIENCSVNGIEFTQSDNNSVNNNNFNYDNGYVIRLTNSHNSIINNNWINLTSSSNYGIYLSGSNNGTYTNNTILSISANPSGFYLDTSSNNTITNGSVVVGSTANGIEYYMSSGADETNVFTNMNWTVVRNIYFDSSGPLFAYRNVSNAPIIITKISAAKIVNRMINNWSQTTVSWNDSINSGTATASYNLTGMLPNTPYNIYNSSVLTYSLTTDSYGKLNFTIALNTTQREIKVNATTTPRYSLNQTNSTIAGSDILHSLYWQCPLGCSGYVAGFCNGTWNGTNCINTSISYSGYNETADSYLCTGSWNETYTCANVYDGDWNTYGKAVPATGPAILYMNYTKPSGSVAAIWQTEWNSFTHNTINITIPSSCWNANSTTLILRGISNMPVENVYGEFDCFNNLGSWTDLRDGGPDAHSGELFEEGIFWGFNTVTNGWVNDSWVPMAGTGNWSNVTKSVNTTVGANISWYVWANDTSNNINQSAVFSYVTTAGNTCSCPASGNWAGVCSDNCTISSNCNMQGNNVSITGTGHWALAANITNWKKVHIEGTSSSATCTVTCTASGCFRQ
jgi:parallel beta-helix repeat protein